MGELVLKIVKNFKKQKVSILESEEAEVSVLRVGRNWICVRLEGTVVLDKNWDRKTNQQQKFKLKDFLGGMYIEEVRKEVKAGEFKVCDLNSFIN